MRSFVKWFDIEKGYGFAFYSEYEDVFIHYSVIKDNGFKVLSEGQEIEFDIKKTDKGLQAINVKVS